MRKLAFAIAAGALFALPLPASAAGPMTDVSSQVTIEAGPRGVGVDVGPRHRRWESDRHSRWRSERRGERCETRTVVRDTPRGRIRKTERVCR
jgi:hypothetical protein